MIIATAVLSGKVEMVPEYAGERLQNNALTK